MRISLFLFSSLDIVEMDLVTEVMGEGAKDESRTSLGQQRQDFGRRLADKGRDNDETSAEKDQVRRRRSERTRGLVSTRWDREPKSRTLSSSPDNEKKTDQIDVRDEGRRAERLSCWYGYGNATFSLANARAFREMVG